MKKYLFWSFMIVCMSFTYGQRTTTFKTVEKTTIIPYNQKFNPDFDSTKVSECEYSGFALHTLFNLPIVRYNINSLNGKSDQLGNLEYFNSIGAGVSFSFGRIHIKSKNSTSLYQSLDDDKTITMKNIVGISAGILFSKSDSIGGSRMMFAPNINLQILDFQLGFGYELGSVTNTAHRCFFTVSYGIPLTKFTGTGSYLLSNPRKSLKLNSFF